MKDLFLQLTKREMQRFFAPRGMWIVTLAVGTVLGLIGPFETDETLSLIPRLAYWVFMAGVTFLTGTVITTVITRVAAHKDVSRIIGACVAIAVSGCAIFAEVLLVNVAFFNHIPDLKSLWLLGANVFAIVVVICVTYLVMEPQATSDTSQTEPKAPALLSRLAHDKRGDLVSISVSDHYVHVTTTRGSEMILLRLRDAIGETHPVNGLQIHRSHWVATDHIARITRPNGKTMLCLNDGQELPISRTYLPDLKKAGFLPKSNA